MKKSLSRPIIPGIAILVMAIVVFETVSCKKNHTPPPPPVDSVAIELQKGLLAYLPFTRNFADSSGNNDTVQVVNGATLASDRSGKDSSALNGTGNGDYLIVRNSKAIKFDSTFSLSMNFLVSDLRREMFVSFVDRNTGYGAAFGAGTNLPDVRSLIFGVVNSSASCDYYNLLTNTVTDSSAWIPAIQTWYNAIFIFNKGSLQMYLNGKLLSSKVSADPVAHFCPNAELIIGAWTIIDPISIYGKLDEFRFYNKVLSGKEIARLAQGFVQAN